MVMVDDKIKGSDQLEDNEDEFESLKEFTIQVGTIPDPERKYADYVADSPKNDISPSIGTFTITNAFVRENGKPLYSAKKPVQCFLRTGSGGGFMIGDDGSFYIMDYKNWSPTKFSTNPEKALRLGKSFISIAQQDDESAEFKTEIRIFHESKANIEIREGYVQIQDKTGRYLMLNEYGTSIMAPEACVSITAKDICLIPDGGSVSIGGFPTDGVIKATHAATLFDTHVHAGPSGPPLPAYQWSSLLQIPNSPLVAQSFKVT